MSNDRLGELEHRILLALLRQGDEAYSVPIVEELEERTGREVAPAAVHVVLRRLEKKGAVESRLRRADPGEGGRERRYFSLTPAGRRRLRESRRALLRLWEGYEAALEEG